MADETINSPSTNIQESGQNTSAQASTENANVQDQSTSSQVWGGVPIHASIDSLENRGNSFKHIKMPFGESERELSK